MERLTESNPSWIDDELWERACEPDCEEIDAVYRKLKEYEDLEEQGRLIKLPCKVGDTVWDNDYGRPCAYTITAFSFGECEEYICEPVTKKKLYSIMQTQAEVSQEVLQKVKSASRYS